MDLDVRADDPHADRATSSADHKKLGAAEVVDEIHEPDESDNSLDNTEETGGEETSVGTSDTNRLEDGGRVVVDGVDTGAVLPEEEHTTEEETVLDLALLDSLEGSPEARADNHAVVLDLSIDGSNLLNHVGVGRIEVTDPAQILDGLLAVTASELPARRFPQPKSTEEKQTGGNELNGEGDLPLTGGGSHSLDESIVDPETNESTDLPSQFVNTDKTSTDRRWRHLRDVDRNHVTGSTNAQTGQNTATNDQSKSTFAVRAQHHTRTKNENHGPNEKGDSASEIVRGNVGTESTEESASLVDGDDVRLLQSQLRSRDLLGRRKLELGDEGWQSQRGSNEGGVITDLKGQCQIVYSIFVMAYLTMHDAKDATDAAAYTRQLYTSLGVGLSSTRVRRPMMRDAVFLSSR